MIITVSKNRTGCLYGLYDAVLFNYDLMLSKDALCLGQLELGHIAGITLGYLVRYLLSVEHLAEEV